MSTIKTSLAFATVVIGLFASSARAQEVLAVKVPFPFVVGQHEFPAGRYDIRTADQTGSVIEIEGIDDNTTNAFAFAQTNSADGFDPVGNQPALVFLRHENEYRLSQIWESTTTGRELPARWGTKRIGRAEEPAGVVAYVIEAERERK